MTTQRDTITVVSAQDEDTAAPAETFQTGQVLTIAGGHVLHDTFSAFLAPLLPRIQEQLSTSYFMAGNLSVIMQLPSLLNPFIGYMADRVSLRYFVILAPAATATLMSIMGMANLYWLLAIVLFAAGISTAAFHAPAPAMIARISGTQTGKGMSFFMASGELGRTVGPLVAAAAVTWWGLDGMWRLAVFGWLTSLFLYWRLHHISARPAAQRRADLGRFRLQARRVFPVLAWVMLPRNFMVVALTTYLPLFMEDVMLSSFWLASSSLTLLEGAGVAGALMTGTVSDRWGRSRVLALLLTLSPLLFLLFLYSPVWLAVPMLLAIGLVTLSPTPVMLALVQDQFPHDRAVANGTFLALNFLIRALAVAVVGLLADGLGLSQAYWISGILALLSVPAVFFLPEEAGPETDGG